MILLPRLTTAVALALSVFRPCAVHAQDVSASPAPDPGEAAALAQAKTLDERICELQRTGKSVEATPLAREALAMAEKALGKDHSAVATALASLASVLQDQGAHVEARPLYERVIAIRERALGKDHIDVAGSLNDLATLLHAQGAYGDARLLYERAIAIKEKALGEDHADLANTLNNLAALLHVQGAYGEARLLFERALAIQEKSLGKDHRKVATTLNNLAALLYSQGAYGEARPLYERALEIQEQAFGQDHPLVASSLNNLALLLQAQGAYAEARPLYERALAINEKALGKDHPDVATNLSNLAELFRVQGAYGEARPLYERALAIYEKTLGVNHPLVAMASNNLAVLLQAQGAYGEARPHLERALTIREKALGKDHPDVANSLNNLAHLFREQGAYGEARPLCERALAIWEHALGKDHPDVANSLNNLAALFREQGAYGEARPLLERALAIREKSLGRDHPEVAVGLSNLAMLLEEQGAYGEARPLLERALAVREKSLGRDHPDVATGLNNLAVLLEEQGAYGEARPLLERALAINKRSLGEDHPKVATSLNNLAGFHISKGAYSEARPLLERALAIYEKSLGKDHPLVATSLSNLGLLLLAQGAYGEARPLLERALVIREKALGAGHPHVASSLCDLAVLLQAQGAYGEALPLFERSLSMTESAARTQFSALGTRQRLTLVRTARHALDHWLRFSPTVQLSGYPEVMRFKGILARTEAAERVLSRRATGEARRVQEALRVAQRLAARLANGVPPSFNPEACAAWQKAYADASAERERLTLELTKRTAPLRVAFERLDLSLADVQANLGSDAALVDFLRVGDRYLAWVVRAAGEPTRIDVGPAAAIEKACGELVATIVRDTGQDASAAAIRASGASLRSLAWTPIEAKLGDGVRRVVICPDAALAAVPFAVLPGKKAGRYLLEDLAVSYVMNAQDLVPWKDGPPSGRGALLVGGVDYEHADVVTREQPLSGRPVALAAVDRAPRGASFTAIPQTRVEVEKLRDRLGKDATTLLLAAEATEARLRAGAKGKRFVHIATHGFAREDLLAGLYSRRIEEAWTSADTERQLAVGHDPMLLSGLAMAGANPREGAGGDDGILTALEASYLDLDGVDLVTLSACSTAKGTAESGEGVLGLVSGFQMAGARHVIASLWKVDDEATRRLMEGLYERLLRTEQALSPADALRVAALALRDWRDPEGKARFAAPRYWAAFVPYGR